MIHALGPGEEYQQLQLGADPERGHVFQAVIHAGCWFGAEVLGADSFSLVGCTVAPGFDFADLELADRSRLLELYPGRRSVVERFTD